jgi:hypothetical protein
VIPAAVTIAEGVEVTLVAMMEVEETSSLSRKERRYPRGGWCVDLFFFFLGDLLIFLISSVGELMVRGKCEMC